MFVFSNLLLALARVLDIVFSVYVWIIIAAALVSWVNPDPYNPIVRFLHRATEPVLRPVRRRLGIMGGLDLSPMIAILVILLLEYFIVNTLRDAAFRIR